MSTDFSKIVEAAEVAESPAFQRLLAARADVRAAEDAMRAEVAIKRETDRKSAEYKLNEDTVAYQDSEFDGVAGVNSNYIGVTRASDGALIEIAEFVTVKADVALSFDEVRKLRDELDKVLKGSGSR